MNRMRGRHGGLATAMAVVISTVCAPQPSSSPAAALPAPCAVAPGCQRLPADDCFVSGRYFAVQAAARGCARQRWPGAERLRNGAASQPLKICPVGHYRLRGGNGASDASWESEGPSEEESSGPRGVQDEDEEDDEDDDDDEQDEDEGDKSDFMDLSAGVDDDAASPGGAQRADAGAAAPDSEGEGENLEDLLGKFIGGDGGKDSSDSQDISNEWCGLLGSLCPPLRAASCALSFVPSVIASTARPGTRSSSASTRSRAPRRACGFVAGA